MFEVDLTEPPPKPHYDMAYRRILNRLRENAGLVTNWVQTLDVAPQKLAGNWKLMGAKAHPDLMSVKRLWDSDPHFQTFLKNKLAVHYSPKFLGSLVKLFLA